MITRLLGRFFRIRLGFVAALVSALTLVAVNEATFQHSTQRLSGGVELTDARINAAQTLQLITDAETAVRGYVITRDEEQLKLYERAVHKLPRFQQDAVRLVRVVGPEREDAVQRIERLLAERLSALASIVSLADSALIATEGGPGHAAASAALVEAAGADVYSGQTTALRLAFDEVLTHAASLQQGARDSLYGAMFLSRTAAHVLSILAVAAFCAHMQALRSADALRRTENERLEGQVSERKAELRELARNLVSAREDERSRLARDLHDELGGLFTAMKLHFARLRRHAALPAPLQPSLASIEQRLDDGIAVNRRVIENLRPCALEHLGLGTSVSILCRDAAQTIGIPVHETICWLDNNERDPAHRLSEEAELTVYRLVQESLTNIAKYAAAREAHVFLEPIGAALRVRVEDDGRGFDPRAVTLNHRGLLGMRYRVESQGGALHLKSAPGAGTRIEAVLPMGPINLPPKSRVEGESSMQVRARATPYPAGVAM
jgi:signal transduction histidine kinase